MQFTMPHVIDTPRTSPAMRLALAQIEREFGPGWEARDLKRRCRAILRGEISQSALAARYRVRAAMLRGGPCLDYAVSAVERWHRDQVALGQRERAARGFAGPRLSLVILTELRLLLRYARRYRLDHDVFWSIERICRGMSELAS